MRITADTWQVLVRAIEPLQAAPHWLREQAAMPYEEILRLPSLDVAAEGGDVLPSVEEKTVTSGYLDFLREQIRLQPRGPGWREVLAQRLAALGPFVNRPVISAMFHRKPHIALLSVDPLTGAVIRFESH